MTHDHAVNPRKAVQRPPKHPAVALVPLRPRVVPRPDHASTAADVHRRRPGLAVAADPFARLLVDPLEAVLDVVGKHAAVREQRRSNRHHYGLMREEPLRHRSTRRERRESRHRTPRAGVRVHATGRGSGGRRVARPAATFDAGFAVLLSLSVDGRSRRRRADDGATPGLLSALCLERGAEELPAPPPPEVLDAWLERVSEPPGDVQRLVVAVHHDELAAGVSGFFSQSLEHVEDGDLVTAAVQLVPDLHRDRRASDPLAVRIDEPARAKGPRRLVQIAVQVPDGDQPLSGWTKHRTRRARRSKGVRLRQSFCRVIRVAVGGTTSSGSSAPEFARRRRMNGSPLGVQRVHKGVDEGPPDGRQRFASRVRVERHALAVAHRARLDPGTPSPSARIALPSTDRRDS